MTEQWKPIPNLDGYEASNMGRIRSVDRTITRVGRGGSLVNQPFPGKVRALTPNKNGYLYVSVKGRFLQVHRLVAMTWVDGFAPGLDAAHENNQRHDNRADNLRWKTRRENISDQLRHGTRLRGERQNGAKLTADMVREMRGRRDCGLSWSRIAKEFGVAIMTAKNAVVGNTWSHI